MITKNLKYILLVAGIVLLALASNAQEYKKQAGFRFGNTTGFTCKFIKDDYFAFEGILGFRSHGIQLYGLFESRRPVFTNKLDNMFLYYGGGLHAGYVKWSDDDDEYYDPWEDPYYYDDDYYHAGPAFGLDGVIGMEYGFNTIPITIAADFKPFFEMYGPFLLRVNFWDFGFHVRYNF
jgi:hypothetical protein